MSASLEDKVWRGPEVVWSRPGQLVLCFAVMLGSIWGYQWANEEPEESEVAEIEVPGAISKALDRADIEVEESAGPLAEAQGGQEKGLVNLFKDLQPGEKEVQEAKTVSNHRPETTEDVFEGRAIEDPGGAMRHFYGALLAGEGKQEGEPVRVVHFGDSVIVSDFVTGSARRKLQKKFGDGGHGWHLIGKPWDYYRHQDVVAGGEHWKMRRITSDKIKDKRFGLGGVTSRTWGPGAWASYRTTDEDAVTGQNLSRVQLYYQAQPKGGKVAIMVDGEEKLLVDTSAEAVEDQMKEVSFEDGPHKVRIQSRGGGEVRVYGTALERNKGGVVYDSVGITGLRAKTLLRADEEHFKTQLSQRDADLVVVMLGTNGSEFAGVTQEEYAADFSALLKRIRAALPGRSCLVASPPDRAKKNSKGKLRTLPLLKEIMATQKRVALEEGCAFWSTFEAMGGENSMVAWYRHNPRLGSGDFTHFTKAGGEALGILFYDALMNGYERQKRAK